VLVASEANTIGNAESFEAYFDADRGDEYWVEKPSGQVRRYQNAAAYPCPKGLADIGEDGIVAAADAYVRRTYNPSRIPRMTRELKRVEADGEVEYELSYVEYLGDVSTFNYVRLTMLSDGTVRECNAQDFDVEVELSPEIESEKAITCIAREVELEVWGSESVELTVIRNPLSGEQILAWYVELQTGDELLGFKVSGYVDAINGAIYNLGTATTG